MGRGDKRSRRGKIFKGSYGNKRSHKTEAVNKPSAASAATPAKKAPVSKKGK